MLIRRLTNSQTHVVDNTRNECECIVLAYAIQKVTCVLHTELEMYRIGWSCVLKCWRSGCDKRLVQFNNMYEMNYETQQCAGRSVFWCCVVVTIMGNNYIYVLLNVGCVRHTRHSGTCVCVCGSLSGVSECIAVGVTITFW